MTTTADPTHSSSPPGIAWTTSNLGEAMPGALTPLCWSLWDHAVNQGIRDGGYRLGVLSAGERRNGPTPVQIFHGRAALRVDVFAAFGDRAPGTSAEHVVEGLFGDASGIESHPTRRRYPMIALRLPVNFARVPGRLRRLRADYDPWWSRAVEQARTADLATAISLVADGKARLDRALSEQASAHIVGIQPVYDTLAQLVRTHSAGDLSMLSAAPGGVEMEMIGAIWEASRDRLDLAELARRFGFHGPGEGETCNHTWREDDTPLRRMVAQYSARPDSDDPRERERGKLAPRAAEEARLLAAAPAWQRPLVRIVLHLVRRRIPLRGVGKRAVLQSMDVARAGARRAGELLRQAELLDHADDIFYLTYDELLDGPPGDARDLVSRRRAQREERRQLTLPPAWRGDPDPLLPDTRPATRILTGVGASSGIVEGFARVVTDPAFDDVEPDEILVASFTDPSWSSIMYISSALVVDIGGELSHAAVVAREIGIPCVVNTGHGSSTILTGDRLRVNGGTGTVEILDRVEAPSSPGDRRPGPGLGGGLC